jgi:hypothetical protein
VLTKFWEGLGTKLAERWAGVATPALLFWAGGLVAYLYSRDGTRTLQNLVKEIARRSATEQVALAVGALVLVATSALVVQRLTLPVIRALEGYWPVLRLVQSSFNRWRSTRLTKAEERWQALFSRIEAMTASWEERAEFAALDRRLRRVPSSPTSRMPTRLGDILRAAESWPGDKYGLDAVKCWPRLWLLLPDTARTELVGARGALDAAAGVWVWGLLFMVWGLWAWWAFLGGLVVAVLAYYVWMLAAAAAYGDLLEASFDVYRPQLYEALRWPLPSSPAEEREQGEALSRYMWRGSTASLPRFIAGDGGVGSQGSDGQPAAARRHRLPAILSNLAATIVQLVGRRQSRHDRA